MAMDEKALYKITYGLYVVSAQAEGQRSGCVVNTLQQVTAEPVRLAVTVNKDSLTCQLIQKAGALCRRGVGPAGGHDGPLAALASAPAGTWISSRASPAKRDAAGMPYPTATACAHYSCKVEQTVDLGTHLLFVGLAEESEILTEDEPLTYSYYRNVIKGLTPKGAPLLPGQKVKSKGEGPRESGALFAALIILPRPA